MSSHHWRFDWSRLPFVASVSLSTPGTDFASGLQHLLYSRKIRATKLSGPPVFVLGHWRSGTTLLHELLQLDNRFGSPNTYQCFAPWHFLVTQSLMTTFGNFLIPKQRPMDNMKAGWLLPQEDEFALMALGANSPYRRIAFPREEVDIDSLATQTFPAKDIQYWKDCFHWFMQAITLCENKPLVLKSPTHTGRLGLLSELYPDAKFIHLSRHPYSMIPSTIKLWQSLSQVQGLQSKSDPAKDEDFVFGCFERMYQGYEHGLKALLNTRLIEVSYEKLTANPLDTLRTIYEALDLGSFDTVRGKFEHRMNADKDYKVNQWQVPEALAARIREVCGNYCNRYGYKLESTN